MSFWYWRIACPTSSVATFAPSIALIYTFDWAIRTRSGDPAYRDLFQKAYGRAPSKVEALIASCVGRTIESLS